MRILIANFVLVCALMSAVLAQQTDSSKDQPSQKKPEAQATKNEKKAPESTTKPAESSASEEHRPDAAKDTASEKDKDKEREILQRAEALGVVAFQPGQKRVG